MALLGTPIFKDSTILSVHSNQLTREVIEACHREGGGAVCGRALHSHARQWIFIFELLNKAVNQPYLHCLACFASHPCCLPPANHGSLEVDTLKQAKLLIRPWSQSNNKRVSCHLNEREHSCLHGGAVSKYDGAPFLAVKCWSVEKKGT